MFRDINGQFTDLNYNVCNLYYKICLLSDWLSKPHIAIKEGRSTDKSEQLPDLKKVETILWTEFASHNTTTVKITSNNIIQS
jgi:hypothetical protein